MSEWTLACANTQPGKGAQQHGPAGTWDSVSMCVAPWAHVTACAWPCVAVTMLLGRHGPVQPLLCRPQAQILSLVGGHPTAQPSAGLTVHRAHARGEVRADAPSPMMPRVSPRILAAPEATSRICSTLWTRVPSRSAWCSQVVLRYRLRMWHMVESAVSSTDAAGTLQTAMPGDTRQVWAATRTILALHR